MPDDDQEEVEWTPIGEAVRRWFPAIAALVGMVFGAGFALVSGSWGAGAVVTAAYAAVLMFGFYVKPLRDWPDRRRRR